MRPVKYLFYSRIYTLSIPGYVHVIRVLSYFVYWIHMISWMVGVWFEARQSKVKPSDLKSTPSERTSEWVSDEQAK